MPFHFTRHAVLMLGLCLPLAAQADDLLDRYKEASTLQAENMATFMVSRVPELEAVIPPAEWTDEATAVGACTIEKIRADRGQDGAEAYVAAVETMAAAEIASLSTMGENIPELLSDMYFMEVAQGCGAMDLAQRQMEESGMLAMMSDPSVMERLAAD
jgi:hypothetical protein